MNKNSSFVYYKKYDNYNRHKSEISANALVFVEDRQSIWTHGVEYGGSGVSIEQTEDGWLFKNNANEVLAFIPEPHTLSQEDVQNLIQSGVKIVVDSSLSKTSTNPIQNKAVANALDTKLNKSDYVVDLELDDESTNPIANNIVKFAIDTVRQRIPQLDGYVQEDALLQYYTREYTDATYATREQVSTKAEASALENYATVDALNHKVDFTTLINYATTAQLATKQNNLTAGNGIVIENDVISTNLDTKVFVVVDQLPASRDANPDKIYIYQGSQYKWSAEDGWKIIGQANPDIDLTPYALADSLNDYVEKMSVYYPSGIIPFTPEGQAGYEEAIHLIDTNIDSSSVNPIQNKAVADALALKANAADVSSTYATKQALADQHTIAESTYATKAEVQTALNTKQSNLTAGTGISIQDGVISSTLDTNLYVIVSELPTVDFDTSKIYILETQNQDGSYDYTAYKYRSQSSGDNEISNLAYGWFPIGITPDVDLSGLATTSDLTALRTLVYSNDQKATNQVQVIQRVIDNLSNIYQPKSSLDDYVKSSELDKYKTSLSGLTEDKILQLMEYLHMRLNWIQEKIAQQYVLKTDVDPETLRHWGTAETYEFDVNEATQGPTFVTMSKARYDYLVQMNQVSKNTYYFTYEGDEPAGDTWQFGGTFPIVLTDNWAFGGTFPIKLK